MTECVLIWVAGFGFVIGIAELLTRFWFRRGGYFPFVPHMRQRFELDSTVLPQMEPVTRLHINSQGERGSEPPPSEANALRILVAGGSGAECYLLDQDQAWPEVMGQIIRSSTCLQDQGKDNLHVGNISRSLLTCASLARVLEKSLPRYSKLDLMITYVGAADVVSWLEKGVPDEVHDEDLPLDFLFQENPESRYAWSVKGCALRRLGIRLMRRIFHPVEKRTQVGKSIARNRTMRAKASHWIDEAPDSSSMEACFERNLRRMIAAAQAAGARVLIARQPWLRKDFSDQEKTQLWNFGRGRPLEKELDTYYTLPVVHSLLGKLDQIQVRVAQDLGLSTVDLMGDLPGDFEHFYDSFHLTSRGAALVGELVAQAIPNALK